MTTFKQCSFTKIISSILVFTFLCLDISFAYPDSFKASSSTLATPSLLQQNPVDPQSARSVLSEGEIRGSLLSIAKFLIEDGMPIKYLERVMSAELGSKVENIDLSGVTVNNGVVSIKYRISGKERTFLVALKDSLAAKGLTGRDLAASDRYVINELDEGSKKMPVLELPRAYVADAVIANPFNKTVAVYEGVTIHEKSRVEVRPGSSQQAEALADLVRAALIDVSNIIPANGPPISIHVLPNVPWNVEKRIKGGVAYLLFDRQFVAQMLLNRAKYPGAIPQVLAERLAHEFTHNDRVGTPQQEAIEERDVILNTDLKMYRMLCSDPVLKDEVDRFFDETGIKFGGRRYYKMLLSRIIDYSPEQARIAVENFIDRFYDFSSKFSKKFPSGEERPVDQDNLSSGPICKDGRHKSSDKATFEYNIVTQKLTASSIHPSIEGEKVKKYQRLLEACLKQVFSGISVPEKVQSINIKVLTGLQHLSEIKTSDESKGAAIIEIDEILLDSIEAKWLLYLELEHKVLRLCLNSLSTRAPAAAEDAALILAYIARFSSFDERKRQQTISFIHNSKDIDVTNSFSNILKDASVLGLDKTIDHVVDYLKATKGLNFDKSWYSESMQVWRNAIIRLFYSNIMVNLLRQDVFITTDELTIAEPQASTAFWSITDWIKIFENASIRLTKSPFAQNVDLVFGDANRSRKRVSMNIPKNMTEREYYLIGKLLGVYIIDHLITEGSRTVKVITEDSKLRQVVERVMKRDYKLMLEYIDQYYQGKFRIDYVEKQATTPYYRRNIIIGLDLGGSSKVKAVVIKDGAVVYSGKYQLTTLAENIKSTADYTDSFAGIIEDVIRDAKIVSKDNVFSVGISWAGAINEKGEIAGSSKIIRGVEQAEGDKTPDGKVTSGLKYIRHLAQKISQRVEMPIYLINDGDAIAFGLATYAEMKDALCMGFGTSLAVGYIDEDGNLATGLGEGSKIIVDMADRAGEHTEKKVKGVVQQYTSEKGVIRVAEGYAEFKRLLESFGPAEKAERIGVEVELYNQDGEKVIEKVADFIAVAINQFHRQYRMERVILSGGVMNSESGQVILAKVKERIRSRYPVIDPDNIETSAEIEREVEGLSEGNGRISYPDYANAIGAAQYSNKTRSDTEAKVAEAAAKESEGTKKFPSGPEDHEVKNLIKLLKSKNEDTRIAAAKALCSLGQEAKPAIPALIKAMDDENPDVREWAAKALEDLGAFTQDLRIKVLIGNLEGSYSDVETASAEIIEMGPDAKRAIPGIIRRLPDIYYHYSPVIKLLDKLGLPDEKVAQALVKSELPKLIKILEEENKKDEFHAWYSVQSDEDEPQYIWGDPRKMAGAIKAIGCIGPQAKAAVPIIIKILESGHTGPENNVADLYKCAVEALHKIGPGAKAAIAALVRVSKMDNPRGRIEIADLKEAALKALTKISRVERERSQEEIESFIYILASDDSPGEADTIAVSALKNIGPAAVLPVLENFIATHYENQLPIGRFEFIDIKGVSATAAAGGYLEYKYRDRTSGKTIPVRQNTKETPLSQSEILNRLLAAISPEDKETISKTRRHLAMLELIGELKKMQSAEGTKKFPSGEEEHGKLREEIAAKNSGLAQFEADSGIASIIILARRAKRENQKLIIGLETDWIPGLNVKNSLQKQAISALMKEIDSIAQTLQAMGLDNVEIIRGSGAGLADSITKTAMANNTNMRNIVVMASTDTINSPDFAVLKDAPENDRPFLAGIDPAELVKFYEQFGEATTKQLYIKLSSIFYTVLELATGKEPPQLPMIVSYDKKLRIIILLPRAEPMDYDMIRNYYAAEVKALQAA